MSEHQEWVGLTQADMRNLLIHLVGYSFGPEPEKRLQEIREQRGIYMGRFVSMAKIQSDDMVLELGSGCGFGTRALASAAKHVTACDISPAYLEYAKKELVDVNNITFKLIKSRDLSPVPDHSVDKVVSTSVFVHLNLYDIYLYFLEFKRVLKPAGSVTFDFADMHRLSGRLRLVSSTKEFLEHAQHYQSRPEGIGSLMQWNSARGIKGVAKLAGFKKIRRFGSRMLFRSSD